MERVLSVDEKIRRAEEMYSRKRERNTRTSQARVNVNDNARDYKLLKKMILQILICLLVYFIFYLIKYSDYVFSEEFLSKTKEILSYDINVQETYNQFIQAVNIKQEEVPKEEIIPPEETNNVQNENTVENTTNTVTDTLSATDINIEETIEKKVQEPLTDSEYIKTNYTIIKPLTGTITSRFGLRNPTTPTVPKNHTGIDIGANTGTVFIAAMEGTVILVSSEGDYRKPYKNTKR